MRTQSSAAKSRLSSASTQWTGNVVVQLKETPEALRLRRFDELSGIGQLLSAYGITVQERVVKSVSADELIKLETETNRDSLPSLAAFWRLQTGHLKDLDPLLAVLKANPSVAHAYRERQMQDPTPVDPSDDIEFPKQHYLQPAPIGIDARSAWILPGGDGRHTRFIDLERGWCLQWNGTQAFLGHEDLRDTSFALFPGVPRDVRDASRHHGTKVLGVVAGVDNTVGVVGIAPKVKLVTCASHYRSDGTDGHIADAIAGLLKCLRQGHLSEGDVLLIEVETGDYDPVEVDESVSIAIARAVQFGFVVVEAAGNGQKNIDALPLTRDSGAIMVGAGAPSLRRPRAPHRSADPPRIPVNVAPPAQYVPVPKYKRDATSNYGSRVHCFALGAPKSVHSTSVKLVNGIWQETYASFGATSAAAAIVAGAAVVLQSIHFELHGRPLLPVTMRTLLSDPALGTGTDPQHGPQLIGTMPDLKKMSAALRHST